MIFLELFYWLMAELRIRAAEASSNNATEDTTNPLSPQSPNPLSPIMSLLSQGAVTPPSSVTRMKMCQRCGWTDTSPYYCQKCSASRCIVPIQRIPAKRALIS